MNFASLVSSGLIASALLVFACGSSSSNSGGVCSVGGSKCAAGCTPTIGCAECATSSDCRDSSKPACVLGKCSQCAVATDCAAGQACFPKDHKCAAACTSSPACPSDAPTCNVQTGACVGCSTNQDCAGMKGAPICEPTRAQCSECATNSDCGAAAPACDLNDGKCHQCLVDAQCAAPAVCGVDRKCHLGCSVDGDCKNSAFPKCTPQGCVAK